MVTMGNRGGHLVVPPVAKNGGTKMRKLLSVLLVLMVVFSFTGCNKKEEEKENTQEPPKQEEQQNEQENSDDKTADKKINSVDGVIKALKNEGIDIKQETDKLAEMVSAKEGKGFFVSGQSFEIYQYAKPEALDKTAKSGKVVFDLGELGKVEMKAVVNKKYLLAFEKENKELTEAFKKLDLE